MKYTISKFRPAAFFIILCFLSAFLFGQNNGPKTTDTMRFQVNMKYMIANGAFDPETDSVDIIGSVNDSLGSPRLQKMDTTTIYTISYVLNNGVVYWYKYRIHRADTTLTEQIDSLTRLVRATDTMITVTKYFNNFDPNTIPVTLNCNLWYQIKAAHFLPTVDYLDVAGSFNNFGAYDVLFPKSKDSIYTITLFLDRSLIGGPPIRFKFRFNGDWSTSELIGDSNRVYTINEISNEFTCWYNDIDPSQPALPMAYNLFIQGVYSPGNDLTGNYTYEDYNLRQEGMSGFQWYRTTDTIAGPVTQIIGSFYINYKVDTLDIGNYIGFEVMPVTNDSIAGNRVRVYSKIKVGAVGIGEIENNIAKVYPNPANSLVIIESQKQIIKADVLNLTGQVLISLPGISNKMVSINVSALPPGIYLLRIHTTGGIPIVRKIAIER